MGIGIITAAAAPRLVASLRAIGAGLAAAALLASCSGAPSSLGSGLVGGGADAPAACETAVSELWATNALGSYTAEATSAGDDCLAAALSLQIRDDRGAILWSSRHRSQDLFGFDAVTSPARMEAALRDWITQAGRFSRSSDLPPWARGAAQPVNLAGFAFEPNPGVDRAGYEALRAASRPLFCHVQGRESVFCLALSADERRVIPIGAQTFPG